MAVSDAATAGWLTDRGGGERKEQVNSGGWLSGARTARTAGGRGRRVATFSDEDGRGEERTNS